WFAGSSTRTPTTRISLTRAPPPDSRASAHPGLAGAFDAVDATLATPRAPDSGRAAALRRVGSSRQPPTPFGSRGPVRNTSRNLPICTSSPVDSTAVSTGSRLTYVPFRLPTSTTTNSPASLRNSAWRRETVTSSRKMSLSGWRPALVTARSRRNRDPALGPRLTTSSAAPSGRASTPETAGSCAVGSASERKSARKTDVVSGARSGGTPGPSFMVTSGSPPADGSDRGVWGSAGQTYRAGVTGTGPGHSPTSSRYASASSSPSGVSLAWTSNIQPSSYGAELITSGVSASAVLTATTVPLTGAKSSETDLVDSTSPTAAPACTSEPSSGSWTNTTSPSWFCA